MFEGGLKLLSSLGEGSFNDGLGLEPDLWFRPGDRSDVENGGVDVGPGVEVVLLDG